MGASQANGLSQQAAEPEVSALRASIPSAVKHTAVTVRVLLDNGKRYNVLVRDWPDGVLRATSVSVWMTGAYNRAGYWRSVALHGKVGAEASARAIEARRAGTAQQGPVGDESAVA
jgi:predicted amidohydrolase